MSTPSSELWRERRPRSDDRREAVRRPRDPDPLAELTEREKEVLALIAEGRSNRAISERLVLSPKTVETHIGQILLKLGLDETANYHRRVLAVLAYLRHT